MNPRRITPGTLALVVAALLVLAVGLYTANGGFQLAGALILLVGIFLAITQASGRGGAAPGADGRRVRRRRFFEWARAVAWADQAAALGCAPSASVASRSGTRNGLVMNSASSGGAGNCEVA